MSEDKVYKILGEFVSYEEKEFSGVNKYIISYKQPNSQDPKKVWKHQAVEADLSDTAIDILVSASTGERFCVHQGKEGGYPVIKDISDAKDVPQKSSGGGAKYKGNNNYTPRDDTGIAVGAAYTNAIEIIKLSGEALDSVEHAIKLVDEVAAKVLKNKLALEEKLRASKTAKEAVTDKAKEEKPKSRAELAKEKKLAGAKAKKKEPELEESEEELQEDDLEDVQFD